MSNLIPISAVIGDRSYRIKIQPDDEEVVRKTLKMINDKILEFRTLFAGKDILSRSPSKQRGSKMKNWKIAWSESNPCSTKC